MNGTVYIYVHGGLVQGHRTSRAFDAKINLEIIDYDNDDCDCTHHEDTHSHEVYELPEGPPLYTRLAMMDEMYQIALRPHEECNMSSDVTCHAHQYGDGNAEEHEKLQNWARMLETEREMDRGVKQDLSADSQK